MSKRLPLLTTTTTPRLYQIISTCVNMFEKKVGGHMKQCLCKNRTKEIQAALTRLPPTRLGTDYLLRSTELLARRTVYIRSYSGLRPMASVPMRVDINTVNMKKAPE